MCRLRLYLLFTTISVMFHGASQSVSVSKMVSINADTIKLDSGIMVPGTFYFSEQVDDHTYKISYAQSLIIRLDSSLNGIYRVSYRKFTALMNQELSRKDTSIINRGTQAFVDPFKITVANSDPFDLFGSDLSKTGSISRGVSFGNNQNLSVNSNLNLQMSGRIAPGVSVLASVTDDNIPIQPEGNTQQLQEFDQVYIKVFEENAWELTAGDFWLSNPQGYFMTYKKRAQGGSFSGVVMRDDEGKATWTTQASGAISKGKFGRNLIQGVEGNQGPYRLTGSQNEPFIIVLSGTERVFIDGQLLKRGQEYDYVVNYNTAEITFTAKNLITKDRRIVVEFQYSDQNYARSLFQNANEFKKGKFRGWINAYSEQDSKNQPIQAALLDSQRIVLNQAGDNLDQAVASSVDTANYSSNRILYYKSDTTIASINYERLIHTTVQDCTLYKATFTNVGQGNGYYNLKEITAVGRIYEWVPPISGQPQGSYSPVIKLAAPEQQQMVTTGFEYTFNESNKIGAEAAYSNYDKNTFSGLDSKDDQGLAGKFWYEGAKLITRNPDKPKRYLTSGASLEFMNHNFQQIERFRSVEFTRNWNTRGLTLTQDQILGKGSIGFKQAKLGSASYTANMYLVGEEYFGLKNDVQFQFRQPKWFATGIGSYLSSDGIQNTDFFRHKVLASTYLGGLQVKFNDEHEMNLIEGSQNGYQFYDWQATLGTPDTSKNEFNVFYRQRIDRKPDSAFMLQHAAIADHYGANMRITTVKNQKLFLTGAYRELRIKDTTLINSLPEQSLVGRLEHDMKVFKGALSTNTYYEIGSGLELKREFLYVEVQAGQGIYTWIDYDEDGVKDLNEFEIAAFSDQANYVRIFTPTNEYVKTFTNQFSQSVYLRPGILWRNEKGFKNILSKFSDQFTYRVDRKTSNTNPSEQFNPFITDIADSSLLSVNSSIRNTFFFNRTSQKFGTDYSYYNTNSKILLTSGFDSRLWEYHVLRTRWNLDTKFTLQAEGERGDKVNSADYVNGRNYHIEYYKANGSFSYQPSTQTRFSIEGAWAEKTNISGGEYAKILDGGIEIRHNIIQKGSLTAQFNVIYNTFTGVDNTTLSYEMLDALKPGQNFTWTAQYQRALGKNLQLSLNYNGRKSPDNRPIHTGGVQVRALF